jgi:hypothetical protein
VASAGASNVVATLVSVHAAPAAAAPGVNYKVEGAVTSVTASSVTLGGLAVDLSQASCIHAGQTIPCAGAFSVGQVVSALSAEVPALPASRFVASLARLRPQALVEVAGTIVEVEGVVSSVIAVAPTGLVVRGLTVDTSGLPAGTVLPAVGDVVRVLGQLGARGGSVVASSVTVVHAARRATFGFEGDAGAVTAGTAAGSYQLSVLGQRITVTAATRLADRSSLEWDRVDPAANSFNNVVLDFGPPRHNGPFGR